MQSTLIPQTKQTGQDNLHRQLRMGIFNVHWLPECDPAYSTQILLWTQDQIVNLHNREVHMVDYGIGGLDRQKPTVMCWPIPLVADDNIEW